MKNNQKSTKKKKHDRKPNMKRMCLKGQKSQDVIYSLHKIYESACTRI